MKSQIEVLNSLYPSGKTTLMQHLQTLVLRNNSYWVGGAIAPAKLEGEAGVGRAQVFRFTFDQKTAGHVRAVVRAKDRKGNEQPESPAWNPSGYFWNGWHAVEWEVGA